MSNTPCIETTDAKNKAGYGHFSRGPRGEQRWFLSHRVAWEQANGRQIPPGMFVCHSCDNPSCVNPEHLFLGTPSDNTRDAFAKGRGRQQRYPGEKNPRAKRTEKQVIQMHMLRAGGMSYAEIGRRFGMSTAVARFTLVKNWPDVRARFA